MSIDESLVISNKPLPVLRVLFHYGKLALNQLQTCFFGLVVSNNGWDVTSRVLTIGTVDKNREGRMHIRTKGRLTISGLVFAPIYLRPQLGPDAQQLSW
jgi:hypothetical protein